MSFGVDVNYKVKKLEARIRAAEEETRDWQMRFALLSDKYTEETDEYKRIIEKFHTSGIALPKGRPVTKRPPAPRGRKKATK